jgi:riboflavin kinase/FMN adenylyltransferase
MQAVQLSGTITRFKGNGRRLGYPTANLTTKTDLADGVYFGFADLGDWQNRPSLIFVGVPTTLGDTKRRIEVHILDIPDEDYYGRELSAKVSHYHRANQNFDSVDQLLIAMKTDEQAARQWFTGHS